MSELMNFTEEELNWFSIEPWQGEWFLMHWRGNLVTETALFDDDEYDELVRTWAGYYNWSEQADMSFGNLVHKPKRDGKLFASPDAARKQEEIRGQVQD